MALCVGLGASASALPTVLGNFPKPANRHFNYAAAGNPKQFAQVFEDVKVGSIDAEFKAGRVFLLHERVPPVVPTKDRHCRPDFPVTTKIEVRFTKSEQASGQSRQHTLGHIDCPACESRKQQAMRVNLAPSLTFREAAELWKNSRQDQLAPGSLKNYGDYIKALNYFFGEVRLESIHIGHVEEYQESRQLTAGPSRINHEMSCLQQILKRAGLWSEIAKYYEPLKLHDPSVGMALRARRRRASFQGCRFPEEMEGSLLRRPHLEFHDCRTKGNPALKARQYLSRSHPAGDPGRERRQKQVPHPNPTLERGCQVGRLGTLGDVGQERVLPAQSLPDPRTAETSPDWRAL
jgi:hypothetical protein